MVVNNLPLRSATNNFAKSQPTADKLYFLFKEKRDNNVNLAQNTGY
jgi:hypothetical protein